MPFGELSRRDEAAYQALGILTTLFQLGDLPEYVREQVAEVLLKADGPDGRADTEWIAHDHGIAPEPEA